MIIPEKLKIESELREKGYNYIAGVDEAGVGAFAGGFAACALIWDLSKSLPEGIDDSKKLSKTKRLRLEPIIKKEVLAYSIVYVPASKINKAYKKKEGAQGYFRSLHMFALRKAVVSLSKKPDFVIVDHYKIPRLNIPQQSFTKGDQLSATIGAASILAKCYRDRVMANLGNKYPNFSHWKTSAGYGSSNETKALEIYGMTPEHRIGFVENYRRRRK